MSQNAINSAARTVKYKGYTLAWYGSYWLIFRPTIDGWEKVGGTPTLGKARAKAANHQVELLSRSPALAEFCTSKL